MVEGILNSKVLVASFEVEIDSFECVSKGLYISIITETSSEFLAIQILLYLKPSGARILKAEFKGIKP